jgi:hypothetical protein
MRRFTIGILICGALTIPAMALPKFHMPFRNSNKKEKTEEAKPEKPASETRKHTDGFPEADKKLSSEQPQFQNWGNSIWKTSSNKDSWKSETK